MQQVDITKLKNYIPDYHAIKLDIGCGASKNDGFVGIDYEQYGDVDIIHNVEQFPWPLPDSCVMLAVASHLVEHINPHSGDSRIAPLINLLISKGLVSAQEIADTVGEINPGPRFIGFMNEVWRVLKPGGTFMMVFPYAGSPGYWQDPTHVNPITEITWWYFAPEEKHTNGHMYSFYQPKPWKIVTSAYSRVGNMEVVLEKLADKPEYHVKKTLEEYYGPNYK